VCWTETVAILRKPQDRLGTTVQQNETNLQATFLGQRSTSNICDDTFLCPFRKSTTSIKTLKSLTHKQE
jgi:hypothetical protein